jgi:hypothetical protein
MADSPDREAVEKVRQEFMRFNELLKIMRLRLEEGERAYSSLFANCSAEERQTLKEKDLQWRLAEELINDTSGLSKAVMRMRFDARELEKAFEELYNIIAPE